MNTNIMMSLVALSLSTFACVDIEDDMGTAPVGQSAYELSVRDVTVVAWVDQGDIALKAYCHDTAATDLGNGACQCDGIDHTGVSMDSKCTICKSGEWPCVFAPDDPDEDLISVEFFEGGNDYIEYLTLNGSAQPVSISLPTSLSCGGTESTDFAVVRTWTSPSPNEILAKGNQHIGLDCAP